MVRHLLASLCVAALTGSAAHAAVISVSGPDSSRGVAAEIIGAPTNLFDNDATNFGIEIFNERQNVRTMSAYAIDGGGIIPAGTLVASHIAFLNPAGGSVITHRNVAFTFNGLILGVMADGPGAFEAASTAELGHPETNYSTRFPGSGRPAPHAARGFEARDSYSIDGESMVVSMRASRPGDWIRIVTAAPDTPTEIPLPATLPLALIGLAALGWTARRRRPVA